MQKKRVAKKTKDTRWFTTRDLVWAIVGAVLSIVLDVIRKGKPLFSIQFSSGLGTSVFNISPWVMLIFVFLICILVRVIYSKLGRGIMIQRRRMYKRMKTLVDNDAFIQGVQLYKTSAIPEKKVRWKKICGVHVTRIGGYARSHYSTNCILSDDYEFDSGFYNKYVTLLQESKSMNKRIVTATKNKELFFDLSSLTIRILEAVTEIDNTYFSNANKFTSKIEIKYFFIYRFAFSLAETAYCYLQDIDSMMQDEVLTEETQVTEEEFELYNTIIPILEEKIQDDDLVVTGILTNSAVEAKMRKKKTRYLSALFYDELWCFSNTESGNEQKQGRCYFAVPYTPALANRMDALKNEYFMMVTYKEPMDKAKTDKYAECEKMTEKILEVIG